MWLLWQGICKQKSCRGGGDGGGLSDLAVKTQSARFAAAQTFAGLGVAEVFICESCGHQFGKEVLKCGESEPSVFANF